MKQGLEYFLLFVWATLTIMTCAAVWNFVSETTLIVVAVLLFGFNIIGIRNAAKQISKLEKKKKEE